MKEDDLDHLPQGEIEARRADVYINRIIETQARATAVVGSRWMKDAACADPGLDPEIWFATSTDNPKDMRRAKEICKGCPVRLQCLRAACLSRPSGTWGGTTQSQRKKHCYDFDLLEQLGK